MIKLFVFGLVLMCSIHIVTYICSRDKSAKTPHAPTWFANLNEEDKTNIVALLSQGIKQYGRFSQDVKQDLITKFQIEDLQAEELYKFVYYSRLVLYGTIRGLNGSIVIQNYSETVKNTKNTETIVITNNFEIVNFEDVIHHLFDVEKGSSYKITIDKQPPKQECTVFNGEDIVTDKPLRHVTITCKESQEKKYVTTPRSRTRFTRIFSKNVDDIMDNAEKPGPSKTLANRYK